MKRLALLIGIYTTGLIVVIGGCVHTITTHPDGTVVESWTPPTPEEIQAYTEAVEEAAQAVEEVREDIEDSETDEEKREGEMELIRAQMRLQAQQAILDFIQSRQQSQVVVTNPALPGDGGEKQ